MIRPSDLIQTLLFALLCSAAGCNVSDSPREIHWISVAAGTFTFGSTEDTPCRGASAEDQVKVTFTHGFAMAETEVTQHQWQTLGFSLPAKQMVEGPDYPVAWINYYEAASFCNALSQAEGLEPCFDLSSCTGAFAASCPTGDLCENGCGLISENCDAEVDIYNCTDDIHRYDNWYECPGYRLPTAAEWQYAAKAGTTTHTWAGDLTDNPDRLCEEQPTLKGVAWYCNNADSTLHPVAKLRANPWGFYDILGNTHEWTDYMSGGLSLDMADGHMGEDLVDPIGRRTGYLMDCNGGSIKSIGCHTRPSRPIGFSRDARLIDTGFRPVRTIFAE